METPLPTAIATVLNRKGFQRSGETRMNERTIVFSWKSLSRHVFINNAQLKASRFGLPNISYDTGRGRPSVRGRPSAETRISSSSSNSNSSSGSAKLNKDIELWLCLQ